MNLGDAKKRALMILDEYSANGTISKDKDLDMRMNDFFDLAQQEVSRVKPIVKFYELPLEKYGQGELISYLMPQDFDRLIRVWADMQLISRGAWMGKRIIIADDEERQITVEYAAFPTPITEQTPDEHEFELAPDAAACLPYYVAGVHLCVDFVVDSGKIMQRYHELLATLSPAYEQSGIEIMAAAGRPAWF